jgi:hypothetical protein
MNDSSKERKAKVTSSRLEARRFDFLQLPLLAVTYIMTSGTGTDAQDCSTLWNFIRIRFCKIVYKIQVKFTIACPDENPECSSCKLNLSR